MEKKKWVNVQTTGDVKNFAQSKGAKLQSTQNPEMQALKGPSGRVLLSSDDMIEVDSQTKDNLWKWFKLIGLLLVPFLCVAAIIGSMVTHP